ncbi:MAG: ribosome maturation factor RimP [Lachnospiraceae bacterium]|nr:ribosome maturation factor RimP [Lachnospiraceae bacterium]
MKIEERAEKLLWPIIEEENKKPDEEGNLHTYEIVDVEYVKEGSDWFLRAYVDKDGGIRIDDCERISRAFEKALDTEDFIPEAYILEVSSPGLTRALKKDRDFERNIGKPVEIHLFKAMEFPVPGVSDKKGNQKTEKVKILIGDLKEYSADKILIDVGEKEEEIVELERKNISSVKQYFEW